MDVRTIVNDTLARNGLSSYARHAEPVIAALEEEISDAVASLTEFAVGKGLSEREARQAFEAAGLVQPEPVAAATTGSSDDGLLQRLAAFARQYGFRG